MLLMPICNTQASQRADLGRKVVRPFEPRIIYFLGPPCSAARPHQTL